MTNLFILDLKRCCYTIASVLCLSSVCLPSLGSLAFAEEKPIKIVLAGDSTVTDHAGWGKAFADLFNEQVTVINLSASGRSSRSFRTEGRWKKCLDQKPDYILIQFGHNDQPGKGLARETDPQTTYKEFLEQYVAEAIEVGAQPILVTSLTRRGFDSKGKIRSTLIPYADAVKLVAREKKVPVIDLHASSLILCEKIGPEECRAISPKGTDRTHLNEKGAKLIAPLIVEELKMDVPALSNYMKET